MLPFTFVHAADLHLDSPFTGLQSVDPDVAHVLREATFTAFARVVDLCVARGADFLLVAGDVFDGEDRSLRAQVRFRAELARLADAGITAHVVHGNHDPRDTWVAALRWPDAVHFFGAGTVEQVECRRGGERLAVLHGTSFARREVWDNLSLRYRRQGHDGFCIGLLHANVGGAAGHAPYAPCSLEDLRASGMDYWALGHVHRPGVLRPAEPAVVYPGNPQGRHPGEDGRRGCAVVSVDEHGAVTVELVPTDQVRWVRGSVAIDGLRTEDELLARAAERCLELQEAEDGLPVVCRLELTGRGPLHGRLRQRSMDDVAGAVRESLTGAEAFVHLDRVSDATRPDVDAAERLRGQDFVGDLLRLAEEYRRNPEQLAALAQCLDELFEHRAARRYLSGPSGAPLLGPAELLALLDEAQARCLDEMVDEP